MGIIYALMFSFVFIMFFYLGYEEYQDKKWTEESKFFPVLIMVFAVTMFVICWGVGIAQTFFCVC